MPIAFYMVQTRDLLKSAHHLIMIVGQYGQCALGP